MFFLTLDFFSHNLRLTLLFEKSPDFNYKYHCSQLVGWGESLDENSNQTSHHILISFAKPATCQMWNFKFPRLKSGELFLPQWIVWVENKLCKTPGPAERWHTARGCVDVSCSRDCCQPPSHEDILLNYILEPFLFYVSYLGLQATWNWFLFYAMRKGIYNNYLL